MGVRSAQRAKRSNDFWSVDYALPRPKKGTRKPGAVPGGASSPSRASMVARERTRLQKRRELVGRTVRLPREWADALNPDNPFALNPHFAWLEWAGKSRWSEELRWMKWATVLPDGTLLKAYSEEGLNRLEQVVLKAKPTMERFGIQCPAFYQNHGWKWVGGCSHLVEHGGITIPQVIVLSTKVSGDTEMLWSLLHELAHHGLDLHEVPAKRGISRDQHQRSLHTEAFRVRFGQILAHYLDGADASEAVGLRRLARSDDYAPPNDPERNGWADP